ncbi:unnamed protein product, partial [Symbiodinium necroappetens]
EEPRTEVNGDEADSVDPEEGPGLLGDYRSSRSGELAGELALSLAMSSLQQA